MAFTHTFRDIVSPQRVDDLPWTVVRPYFSDSIVGPFVALSDVPIIDGALVSFDVTDAPQQVGWFEFEFDRVPSNPSVMSDPILSPVSALVTDPTWAPTINDVADLLFTRTKDSGGNYLGVFSSRTNPTNVRAAHLVNVAQDHVISDLGGNPSAPAKQRNARHLTSLYAAMLVELSHYSEQITRDISPYKELKKLYDSELAQLEDETPVDAGKGAEDSAGNPTYHFDGFAAGYKRW